MQETILSKTGTMYGEPSISAAIRNQRKFDRRLKFGLPPFGEVIEKRWRPTGKGYQYKYTKLVMEKEYERRQTTF